MAIFHLSVKTVSRSAGRSSTAASAYRAGVEITDRQTGEIHDYRRKVGVESAELFLPAGAPKWATDRAELWNAAEVSDKRKNSTVAREFEVALPAELSADQRRELAHDFTRAVVKKYGFAADCAIHLPGKAGDSQNHHAHILCTTRKLTLDGFTVKTRELDDRATGAAQVVECRELFASMTNAALEKAGHSARVDHRSLEAQGIDREAGIHLGPTATAIERRGEVSQKTEHHQERQAAAKVSAMVAIAQAKAEQDTDDERIRVETLSFLDSNVHAAERASTAARKSGTATDRACAFAVADHAGTSQSLGAAGANLRGFDAAVGTPNQHMDAARAAWPSTVSAVRASENDLRTADEAIRSSGRSRNPSNRVLPATWGTPSRGDGHHVDHSTTASLDFERAIEGARRRLHNSNAGAASQAFGRSLERLVPALAAIPRRVELHLVELALEAQAKAVADAKAQAVAAPAPAHGMNPRSAYHPDNIAKREAQEAKEREMATQKDHDLVAVAMEHRKKYGYSHPSKEVLKAVDEVLIDQARTRLGIPLPVDVVEPAPAIPIQPIREAVPPALSLVDQLKASFAKFVEWVSGNSGKCIEVDTQRSDHYGPVVQRDDLHAVQRTGPGKFAIHQLDRLDKLPALDDPKMEIKYRDGVGQVKGKLGQEIER